jgi:hypothetical protein
MPLAVLAAVVFGNVPDGLLNGIRHFDAGMIAWALRPVGVLAAERLLAGVDVNPSALAQVAYPHTIILLASARSLCFSMMMAANATSAAAAITIHRDLI